MQPEWLNEEVAHKIAKDARLAIGQIATLKYPITKKDTVWDFFVVLCVSYQEFRYFDTEEEAAAMRVLRGLKEPTIIQEKFGVGFGIIRPETSVKFYGGV